MIKSTEDCACEVLALVVSVISVLAVMLAAWLYFSYNPVTYDGVVSVKSEQVKVKK